ncbi:nuclear export mediator factor NEMF isoform X1 [Tanacetum coccineum]|uniref:Nuclear export mediator factor NEMF isoform X1 n=1 Tax=Tanacetum coccineum TaxID=301880 RepID=A0ABQ5H586_9ASTR
MIIQPGPVVDFMINNQNVKDPYGSLEKLRPEKELECAKSDFNRYKLKIRDMFKQIDTLLEEGKFPESLYDSDGLIYSKDIFCSKCAQIDVRLDNDIILCDGALLLLRLMNYSSFSTTRSEAENARPTRISESYLEKEEDHWRKRMEQRLIGQEDSVRDLHNRVGSLEETVKKLNSELSDAVSRLKKPSSPPVFQDDHFFGPKSTSFIRRNLSNSAAASASTLSSPFKKIAEDLINYYKLDHGLDRALEFRYVFVPDMSVAGQDGSLLNVAQIFKRRKKAVDEYEDNNNEEKKGTTVREKPYISKDERKKLKKGQTQGEVRYAGEVKEIVAKKKKVKVVEPKDAQSSKVEGGGKSAGRPKVIEEEPQSEVVTAGDELKSVTGRIVAPKRCYKCKKEGHLAKVCQERADEAGQERANSRYGDDDTLNDVDKIAMEKYDIKEIGEDEKEKLTYVDYLTGNPLPNDILLYAVPVYAPYIALQSYKYHVKIIP